jgi:signal transduction histidine kinase/ligand-binding sensor domain-containing protein/CheY-like chemotaxis protein
MIVDSHPFIEKVSKPKGQILLLLLTLVFCHELSAQKIHKFERLSMTDGLSQNYVQSILCDDKGFLWFGTWDGLNRYDGRQFKIFKVNPNQKNTLTNNRIIELWQDKQHTLWVKTNDGYFHYFTSETYEFITYPYYLKSMEERNSTITCFVESGKQEVLLGSSNSGLYYLTYNPKTKRYDERQYLNRGESTISDNTVSFVLIDDSDNIWIGTKRGLNNISQEELKKENPSFSNYWLDFNFTVGFRHDQLLLFGTKDAGIKTYEPEKRRFDSYPQMFNELSQKTITIINSPFEDKILIGTKEHGLYVYDISKGKLQQHLLEGKAIKKVFKDSYDKIWINTNEFGIYMLGPDLASVRHYELTDDNIKSIVDDERQFIYEDSQRNLWIALHGNGLAHFNRGLEKFDFYRNVPGDASTISSDNVYCIAEDHSGMLWVGTGPADGGVNKIYTSNETFRQILLEENVISGNENVVRALLVDDLNNTWVGTKSGEIYILDRDYQVIQKMKEIHLANGVSPGQNAYAMMQDKDGFVWIGTKGGGVFVTQYPVADRETNYKTLKFYQYENEADNESSLSSNIVYSLLQDSEGRIWIGSYEGGLNLVTGRSPTDLECIHINTQNSDISSDKVRNLLEDHSRRLWIATAFGVNYLDLNKLDINKPNIHAELFDPRKPNSLSYNDVIHVFEDSRQQLWLGTSGGGVNKLVHTEDGSLTFEHINTSSGLINDIVYSIIEDPQGLLWFSTDHGITRYNPIDGTFDNFDDSNNLSTDAFNENTSGKTSDGRLLFGTNEGLLIVHPDKIEKNDFMPHVVFTNFQLFNKDVDIHDRESPVQQDIEALNKIVLEYYQSSFSIEYAALSYFAPSKNKYAFMLENFDDHWNEVGNQNKATYTNLAPGEYIFKVKAANWNSDWSDKTRSIAITITPPWWKTTAMYIVYFVTLAIILDIIRRSYTRYHKLQNDLKVEKRVNDIKLQFFTNISHEIRTPLTLILGPIHDIMELKNIPKNIASKLHLVEKNGKRMLRLVNQLLDFRKVQKNKMALKVHKVEINSFLTSIVENFDLIAEHKKIDILFKPLEEELDIWADPNKFDSVIFNILSNALKFSPQKGTVKVSIETHKMEYVDIIISDEGSGIPKNRIDLIFQRFSPLSEDDEEFGGSGIGLAYSYQIMKLHHGDIIVKSEIDSGSEFTVRVLKGYAHFSGEEIQDEEVESLYKINHEREFDDEDDEKAGEESEEKDKDLHILIVEDNHQILNYLKENLLADYHISTALNGAEALDIIQKKPPELVITDVMMPVMDGITLTRKLKDSFDTSHIPVIMLTAKSSMEDQIEGIESGAEAYILKPFNMAYVCVVIGNLIRQRSILYSKYIHNKDHGFSELKITTKDEKFLDDISKLIMDNYSDPEFNIEKLVEQSYVSRTVFYHKIKTLTGLTPIDFLRQKRLHIASQMILETDYNVSEIALITGFNDAKNFSKRFKEIYKLTPTQYKHEMMSQN